MPTRPRSADGQPKRPPTFVYEMPLRVSPAQERTLLARLEAARQVYNACLHCTSLPSSEAIHRK